MTLFLHPSTLPRKLRPIHIEQDGMCNVCHAFMDSVDEAALLEEAQWFAEQCGGRAVVLFSGGKDSVATLYAAKERLGLDPVALLYDNGLIPAAVTKSAQDICQRLGVPLHIHRDTRFPGGDGRTFSEVADDVTATDRTPCIACGQNLYQAAAALAADIGTDWLVQGTHYFAQWQKRPGSFRVFPRGGRMMKVIHLPFALGLTVPEVYAILDGLAVTPASLPGVSTNCLLPAKVQARVQLALGHVPEREDLALEVLVGHLSREAAEQELLAKSSS